VKAWWLALGCLAGLPACSDILGLDDYGSGTGNVGAASSAGPTGSGGTSGTATGGTSSGGSGGAAPSFYASVVLADGPVAYWRLGEAYSTQVAEDLVNDLHGSYVRAQPGVDGLLVGDVDTAVSFTSTALVTIESNALSFTGDTDFTVEAWVKPTELGYANIFSSAVSYPHEPEFDGYAMYISNGSLCLKRADVAEPQQPSCGGDLITLTKAHVVATYSRGSACVRVNLTRANCSQQDLGVGMNTANAVIGGYFEGTIDEVAVYAKVLSVEQITAHYNAGMGM
jgi:hypothetical protein